MMNAGLDVVMLKVTGVPLAELPPPNADEFTRTLVTRKTLALAGSAGMFAVRVLTFVRVSGYTLGTDPFWKLRPVPLPGWAASGLTVEASVVFAST